MNRWSGAVVDDSHTDCISTDLRVSRLDVWLAGPIELRNPGLLMDVRIGAKGMFEHSFPSEWNAFAYIYDGDGTIGNDSVSQQHAVVMEAGDYVKAASDTVRSVSLYISGAVGREICRR